MNEYNYKYNLSEMTEMITTITSFSFTSSFQFSNSNDFTQSSQFSNSNVFIQEELFLANSQSGSNSKAIIIGTSIAGGVIVLILVAFIVYK
jgi:hypothetical protein